MPKTSQKIKKRGKDLEFAPVPSKTTVDLSPETFKHSDEFSKMMDRARRLAMRRNDSFSGLKRSARQVDREANRYIPIRGRERS